MLGFHAVERYDEEMRHLMLDSGNRFLHLFENPELHIENAINWLSVECFAHIAFGTNREYFPEIIDELKVENIFFRGPLFLGQGESVHYKDPDGNYLEIRCPA